VERVESSSNPHVVRRIEKPRKALPTGEDEATGMTEMWSAGLH